MRRAGGFASVSGGSPALGGIPARSSPAWARAGRLENEQSDLNLAVQRYRDLLKELAQ
jgi:hypothetical protein